MKVNGVDIDDTFAEAFGMSGTGVVLTADTAKWARICATVMTGFGTSVIGCGAECGIDRELSPEETPDGRPGVRVLLFGFSPDALLPQLKNRVGQCVLTSPGSACFNGVDSKQRLKLAAGVRPFGDGWQTAKKLGARRFWRVPVMDGEFVSRRPSASRPTRSAAATCSFSAATAPACSRRRKRPSKPSPRSTTSSRPSPAASSARAPRSAPSTRA